MDTIRPRGRSSPLVAPAEESSLPHRYSHLAARGLGVVVLGLAALVAVSPPAHSGLQQSASRAEASGLGSRAADEDLSGVVQIVGIEGEAVRVRRAPDARAEARGFLAHGTRVEILDGPVQ